MLSWLRAQPYQPATLDELQALLDSLVCLYTSSALTARCLTAPPRPPSTTPCPRLLPAPTASSITTTASATTSSTKRARSPSAMEVASSISASGGATPEPPSSCSSRTSTSESSTRPRVNSSEPSPSTPPGHISPPAGHPDHHLETQPELRVQGDSYVLRDDTCGPEGLRVRPHRALGRRTPVEAFNARLKARPEPLQTPIHYRVRRYSIDDNGKVTLRYLGRLRHIAVGARHRNRKVHLLVAGADVRIVTTDGVLLRALTLDPARDYQALGTGRWPVHDVLRQASTMS